MSNEFNKHLIEALATREICKANVYMTEAEATEQHLDMIYGIYSGMDKGDGKKAVEIEKKLLSDGKELFNQGYRIRRTTRGMLGLVNPDFEIGESEELIVWRHVSAGHIAGSEAERIEYVVKLSK